MDKLRAALPGMRTIKTAVAVIISFLVFLPFWGYSPVEGGPLDQVGPFYACIASVICMQGSLSKSKMQGLSRIIGTLIGGGVGLLILTLGSALSSGWVMGVTLGLGVLLTIWVCNRIGQPGASSIGAVVCCAVLLSHSGEERYFYTIARVGETIVGILVALAVNRLLPGNKEQEQQAVQSGK